MLPDGCTDLIWHEDGLLVAGPDTRAQFSDLGARRDLTAAEQGVYADLLIAADEIPLLDHGRPAVSTLADMAEGLERAGSDPSRAKLRTALAGIRNWDMGGFVVDYSGQSPYVGSRFIDLGVLNGAGRFLG